MKKSVLIISHGSRDKSAQKDFRRLVQSYRRRHSDLKVVHAYLEMAGPTIPRALETLAKDKSDLILILPLFLFAAKHIKKHIPEIIITFRKKNPSIKVKLANPLASDLLILDILDRRLKQISK